MVQIFSFGERWNVPFNEVKPSWMEHFIFHWMKIFNIFPSIKCWVTYVWSFIGIISYCNPKFCPLFCVACRISGADPRMVRIGTGPPFWQINHANSAYFRLFLGYFRVISATRPPLWISASPFYISWIRPCILGISTQTFAIEISSHKIGVQNFVLFILHCNLAILLQHCWKFRISNYSDDCPFSTLLASHRLCIFD